ncbi:MAG: BamA/TamA family outer membrane protein, partial [Candidatus Zixiibacteriota bacterium]
MAVLKYTSKGLLLATYENSFVRHALYQIFAADYPVYPLASYGSNPGLEGGLGLKAEELFSNDDVVKLTGSYSTNSYQRYRIKYHAPHLYRPSAGMTLIARYSKLPRESLYGLGSTSLEDDEVSVTREESFVRAELFWEIRPALTVGFEAGYWHYDISDGEDTNLETNVDTIKVSLGLGYEDFRPTRFWGVGGRLRHDWRNHMGQPTRGGVEEVSFRYSHGIGVSDRLRFTTTRVDLRQYLHLFRKRTLALRALAQSVDVIDAASRPRNPFYLLSSLGGQDDLRGYPRDRFIDNDYALVSLEYRYPLWPAGDGVLFLDEGRVFHSISDDFTLRNWRYSAGVGIRVFSDA